MQQKHFRVDDKLSIEFENEAKQRGKSENDLLEDAIKHFLECKKTDLLQQMRLIVTKFDAVCMKCGKALPTGSWVMWSRGVGVLCGDCHVQKFGDKTTAKAYLKVKELDFQKQALTKECDRLAERFRGLNIYEVLDELHKNGQASHKLLMDYLKGGVTTSDQEKKTLEDMERLIKENVEVVQDVREYMANPYAPKKKKAEKATAQ